MSEKLTDEQLRKIVENYSNARMVSMATEIIALRAEREKLEGVLREARFYAVEYGSSKGVAAIDAALDQPAENGAAERGETLGEALDRLAGAKP